MARIPQEPKKEHIDYLKSLVAIGFSKSVTTAYDCSSLATAIETTIQKKVSVDTLRRFFGIIKSTSLPSTYTLDVLSKYVGYKNWNDLIAGYQEQNQLHQKNILFELLIHGVSYQELVARFSDLSKTNETYELFNQIILIKAQQKDIAFFENIFDFKVIFELQESFKYAIYHTIHLLGSLCITNDWLQKIAIAKYYNLPYDVDYFVELLVIPEHSYYLELLENYHRVTKDNTDKTVFYYTIKCTTLAKNGAWKLFSKHYDELMTLSVNAALLNNFLQMRWFGVQLIHDHHFNRNLNSDYLFSLILESTAINTKDAGTRVSSVFIITQYLLHIKNYLLILDLFEKKVIKYSNILGYWAELNYNQLKVYYSYALVKTNQAEKARIVFKEIKPEMFDLNFKKEVLELYEEIKTI